jgi:dsDNA-specific endonuclease/ATPase MutS2
MKTNFKLGDKVSFLNEKGTGIITNIISPARLVVTNEDGFEVSVSISEIVPRADSSSYQVNIRQFFEKDEQEIKPPRLSQNESWEIDLHLSEILDSGREMSDHEKLLAQLKYFRKCLDAAISHHIKKIIVIHGVGKGTLKEEVHYALKSYDRVRYYAAPFKEYGMGATIVEIH